MVKVSVIIPVYDTEEFIAECLDSVIAQDMQDWEIICIDDASTDGSAAIMRRYEEQDSRIHVIRLEKNGGQAAGRNLGLREAQGEYVYFLDSDDMLKSNSLGKLCRVADSEQVEGVIFDAEDFFESPELAEGVPPSLSVSMLPLKEEVVSGERLFMELCVRERGSACQPGRYIWRRSYLLENGITNDEETSPHEDELFFMRSVITAKRMIALPESLHLRRYRAGSVMTGHTVAHDLRHCRSYLLLWLRSGEFIRKHTFSNQLCAEAALHYASMFLKTGVYYARCIPKEQRCQMHFSDPLDDMSLHDVLTECIRDSQTEIFLSTKDVNQILNKERIFLYGAGGLGQKVLQILLQIGCHREKLSFIVTDNSKFEKNVAGVPVRCIDYLDAFDRQRDVIVLAVTRRWSKEVISLLDRRNLPYVELDEGLAIMAALNNVGK